MQKMRKDHAMIITIDGPAASGKSTVAYLLAKHTGGFYINSGLLFRALAFSILRDVTDPLHLLHDQKALDEFVQQNLAYDFSSDTGPVIYYKGEPITSLLKTPEVTTYASVIAEQPTVRITLLNYQRTLARNKNVIADGRDCGTVVFPDAEFKFFITADEVLRAQRLQNDLAQDKRPLSFQKSITLIHERDSRDSGRSHAPMTIPPDAYCIDNSTLTIEETLNRVLSQLPSTANTSSSLCSTNHFCP